MRKRGREGEKAGGREGGRERRREEEREMTSWFLIGLIQLRKKKLQMETYQPVKKTL